MLYVTCRSRKHTDWYHCTSVLSKGCSSASTGTSVQGTMLLSHSQRDTVLIHTATAMGKHQLICSGFRPMKL